MSGPNRELDRVEKSWNQLASLIDSLGDEGLMAAAPDGWTVKDHVAHVAAWEVSLLALLEGADRPAAMGLTQPLSGPEIDAINESIRKLHQDAEPGQVMRYFRDSHAQLVAELSKLDDVDLQKPYAEYQPSAPDERRPVVEWIAGNTYEHYAEHIGWINQVIEARAAR